MFAGLLDGYPGFDDRADAKLVFWRNGLVRQAIAQLQRQRTVASGADFQRCWGRAQIRRILIADAS